jgi:hypothetical protein
MAPYFDGTISPQQQHDSVFTGTKYGSHIIPILPLMPLPISGVPTAGSAIQSGSTTTINSTASINAVAGGMNGNVQFNNGGALAGSNAVNFSIATNTLTITGAVTVTGSIALTGTVTADIFNAVTGFEIGGTAGVGKYLRGNGTNFVSSTLSGSDVLAGIVGVQFGGTGANLSATGGASFVVRQSSVGAAFTVSQLTAADLTNGTTGTGAIVLADAPTFTTNPIFASFTGTGAVVLATSPTITTPKWTAFTVAGLPAGLEGQYAYATDGRKVGEGVGAGTGVPIYFSNTLWRVFSTDTVVLA